MKTKLEWQQVDSSEWWIRSISLNGKVYDHSDDADFGPEERFEICLGHPNDDWEFFVCESLEAAQLEVERRIREAALPLFADRVAKLENEARITEFKAKKYKVFSLVESEFDAATAAFPKFNSAHEGFAVILEELDELKEQVWRNQKSRDHYRMQREAVQVAAMAIRFLHDVEGLVRCEGGES